MSEITLFSQKTRSSNLLHFAKGKREFTPVKSLAVILIPHSFPSQSPPLYLAVTLIALLPEYIHIFPTSLDTTVPISHTGAEAYQFTPPYTAIIHSLHNSQMDFLKM